MTNNQYEILCQRVIDEGKMIYNERTGTGCLTLIGANMEYDVENGLYPIVTTRKAPFKMAIAELLGYLRGYDNADQFAQIGAKTWYANANETQAWVKNPNRKGENDCGRIYGVQARGWQKPNGEKVDLLRKIYEDLRAGKDDRGEILTYWNPGEFDLGCLRPCMHTFQFSLLDGKLYMDAYQRSNDLPLGTVANMQQCYVLLALMAQITGNKPGKVFHRLVNCHIYEPQLELMKVQLSRSPKGYAKLQINPEIKTLEDIETWVTTDDFTLSEYECDEAISYPFAA